ncbi:MAG: type II toxin-antitoxin system HicA family toxin [Armatimonadetes bacterium]|nr:MAG: type II toxin-antitoxin system HicA family toxin [Armatimonadota bacterium]
MKRGDFLRHLRKQGCQLLRQGKKHEIWLNPANQQTAPVPRHQTIDRRLGREICRQLEIPPPTSH